MSTPSSAHNVIASSSTSLLSTLPTAIANIPLELLRAELARRQADDSGAGSIDGGAGGGPAAAAPSSKPACGTKGVQAEYSVSSHVFALVLILILSTVACAFPILARRFPKLPIPHHFLFLSRHFGTGVLIATAFVHLLPTAFHSLSDPCLPDFWTKAYTPMPGLVAMIAVLVVVGIEMFFASQGAGHVHGSDFDQAPSMRSHGHHGGGAAAGRASAAAGDTELEEYEFGATGRKEQRFGRPSRPRGYSELSLEADEEDGRRHEGIAGGIEEDELDRLQSEEQDEWGGKGLAAAPATATTGQNGQARGAGRKSKDYEDEDDADLPLNLNELGPRAGGGLVVGDDDDDDDAEDLLPSGRSRAEQKESAHRRNVSHKSAASIGTTAEAMAAANNPALAQRLLLQCALLEAGILFHSVFIGMAVSVTRGSAFVVLLIAIAFHQTFEGFALGARISSIVPLLPPGSARPWLMCLAYGTTTPLGQAIGLAIHGLYDPKSEAGLILVGCMNAISSGLLLFAGLVELLAEDFLSENSYKILRGRRRTEACICVVLGSLLMAAVGAFA